MERETMKPKAKVVKALAYNMNDVMEAADYITVLRLGQTVAEFKKSETSQREVVEAITAGQLSYVPGMEEEVAV